MHLEGILAFLTLSTLLMHELICVLNSSSLSLVPFETLYLFVLSLPMTRTDLKDQWQNTTSTKFTNYILRHYQIVLER